MFFRKKPIDIKPDDDTDDDFEDGNDDLLETIEIIAKDTNLNAKELVKLVKAALANLPTVNELKAEIKELKQELKAVQTFNQELVLKLIDKPSGLQAHLANRAAVAANSGAGSATAGPKGKLP